MTTLRLTLALVVGLFVAGCSWPLGGSDETAPPTIASVDPPLGNNATDVRVTILGTGFFRLLVRDLNSETGFRLDDTYQVTVGGVPCRNVVRVDDGHLLATIPAGLAEGPHDVVAINPAQFQGLKEQGYYATSAEAPVLNDAAPRAAVNDAAQVVVASGTGLRSGAQLFAAAGTVEVVDVLTATAFADDPAGSQTATSKQVIVPAGLTPGPYTLAVKNPDGQRAQLSGVFQVVTPAQLQLALTAPAQVSVGQAFTVQGALTNGGGSDAESVTLDPATVTGTGGATVGATSTPPTTTVPAGGQGSVALTAQATQAGTLRISTRATGTNAFSLRALASAPTNTGDVLVQRATGLTATVSVSPAAFASVGQPLTVTMQVQNTGEATANAVTPSSLVLTGAGNATLVSGPSPASAATLAGGSSTTFTWQYTASAPGALTFSGSASGADANSAQMAASASAPSTPVQVQTPAQLSIISFAVPGTIARGQTFTATMVVANIGEAAANAVLPVPSPPATTVTGGAAASTSTSISPVTIPGLGSATFTWTYAETGTDTGTIALVAAASGTDANSSVRVTSAAATSNTASVQAGSDLRIISFDIPSALTTGQTFSATMTVQNFGGTTAIGVLPSPNPPTLTATGGAGAATSSSVLPAVIPPSGTATFVWSYTATGTGTISFSTGASGTDATTGGAVNAPTTPSNLATVVTPSGLTITSFSIPTSVSRGQTFTATMQVVNNGGATAQQVVPDPPTVNATGGAGAVTSTSQTPVDITSGNSATFTWTYTENGTGPGTLQLSAGASGVDGVTGNDVFANPTSTNLAQVQDPARLQVSSFTIPTTLSRGQAFNAVMVVRNLGQAPASNVSPSPNPPTLTATGGAGATTTTTFTPQSIPGGGQATFTWAYTENGGNTGTLMLNGGAAGTDANSGAAITATPADTPVATVEAPARLQVTSVTVPARLARGQTFNVQVTVDNLGEATALGVLPNPSPPSVAHTGGANATSASAPAARDIPAGQSATFLYTYTENGTGTGTLTFSTGASGTDANSGQTVTAPSASSPAAIVETPAALSITSFTLPANVSRGSTFSAVLVVSNTGQATARNVLPNPNPPVLTNTGGANAATSTTLTPVDIPGGGNATFTWTYTETGTNTGTLRLATGAAGTDADTGAPVSVASSNSNVANVQQAAALSVTSFTVTPAVLSRGQTFTAALVVRNNGQAAANGVLPNPNPPSISGTGGAGATTSTTLTPATIAGGATATFTWSFTENGSGPGTLALAAGASGTDANSGAAVSAASTNSNTVTVQTPPQLTVSSLTVPARLSRGQGFNVIVVVTNGGQATANGVRPSPTPPTQTKTGGASATTSTNPAAVNIAGGASATFTYAYTENGTGTGTLQFSAGAAGTDANSGAPASAPAVSSVVSTVEAPAALQVTTLTIPGTISRGQTFTATAVVTNTGGATASNVLPSPTPPTVGHTGGARATCTGTPAPATLASGATATFIWSCTENGSNTGTLTLSTGATGTDVNSGAAVTGPSVNSNTATVQNPGVLNITAFTLPSTLTRGQAFTASMTVQNTGSVPLTSVLPSPAIPTLTPTGGANATTGTTFSPQTLAPGASTTFTWSYLENGTGTGTLVLTGAATGNDGAGTVTANATSTNLAQVQTPPSLSVTAFTLPARISSGQTFQASMTVSNTGQATASNVLPSPNPPTVTTTGSAGATTSTTLTPASIPSGGSATFTWTYTAGAGTGTLQLSAGASGNDANNPTATVTAAPVGSNTATVEAPAQLSVTSFTAPATISRGQTFQLAIVIRNNGSATANGVLPSPNPPTQARTGGANATTSSALTAVNIAGGASANFTWTYTENGTGAGTITFTAGAAGTDANSGLAVSAASTTSNTMTVQTPPSLSVTAFTLPANLSRGQTFQAQMTVANSGQATANGVLPSPNPPTLSKTGGANATTGTALTAVNIAGGASATFTWSYTENGTGTGTVALSAGASGTDANSAAAVSAPVTSSNTANVQTPASLTITSLTLPAKLSRGQTFTATMVVSNTGQAAATNVVPSPDPLTQVVTGGAAATTATTHTGVTIAGGATATITWTYTENGTGTGTLALQGGATGTDANSGAALTAAAITSAVATVEQKAALQVTSFTIPANLSRGQTFTATMVVTNTGQATANSVLPSPNPPTQTKTGGANATTSTALTAVNIAGGASATFSWTYTENGTSAGTLQLSAGAAGTDANSGVAVTAASTSTGVANVVNRAALTSAITGPTAAVAGDQFAVTMLVTNTGGAPANAVTPSALTPTVTGVTLSLLTSPSPATINGGASFTFVWTYSTSAASNGTVRFSGNAAGTDAYSGTAVASTSTNSNTTNIVTPAAAGLTSAIVTKPRVVPVSDVVTVEMTVTNRSTGTRSTIAPSDLTLAGPGQVTLLSGPTPASFNLIAGANATFSWTYRATAPGWVTFAGNATSTTPADASARSTSPALAIRSPSCSVSTLAVNAGPDRTITNCNQNAALGGSPTASGGNPSYVYEWTPITNVSNPAFANPTANPKVSPATYTVTVTDGDGCQVSDSMVVT
ncbi:MAG TPA: hypothetical protein VIG99_08185, partial [Myxococcaceae bacterium]